MTTATASFCFKVNTASVPGHCLYRHILRLESGVFIPRQRSLQHLLYLRSSSLHLETINVRNGKQVLTVLSAMPLWKKALRDSMRAAFKLTANAYREEDSIIIRERIQPGCTETYTAKTTRDVSQAREGVIELILLSRVL